MQIGQANIMPILFCDHDQYYLSQGRQTLTKRFCYQSILLLKTQPMNIFKMVLCQPRTSLLLEESQLFSPSHPSPHLLQQLHHTHEKQTLKMHLQKQQGAKQLAALGLLACLLVHGHNFEELAEEALAEPQNFSKDWLHNKIVGPFRRTMKSYCETSDFFSLSDCKQIDGNKLMRYVPYLIKVLKELCVIGQQLQTLGRYFTGSKNQMAQSCAFFSEAFLIFTNEFYTYLRLTLQSYLHMLRRNREEIAVFGDVLRWLLGQVLPQINESLLKLNYNKYFRFSDKRMTIKLFRVEQQSTVIQELIHQIMRPKKGHQNVDQDLESRIFPEDGSFNEELFIMVLQPSMKQISIDEETDSCIKQLKKNSSMVTTESDSPSFTER